MAWKCPACDVPIRHSEIEERPRVNTIYRCPVCRLELVVDSKSDKLTVAPMRDDETDKKERTTR